MPSTSSPSPSATPGREGDDKLLRKLAAALGASGVALGAMGAHALKSRLEARSATAMWQTASVYQLFHAAALLGLAGMCESSQKEQNAAGKMIKNTSDGGGGQNIVLAGKLLSLGTALFSGSIYCLALNVGPKALLGPTTPIGGLIMIGGWVLLGL